MAGLRVLNLTLLVVCCSSGLSFGQTLNRMVLVPVGVDPSTTVEGTDLEITRDAGTQLDVELYIENALFLLGWEAAWSCTYSSVPAGFGDMEYVGTFIPNVVVDGSMEVDTTRPDWLGVGAGFSPTVDEGMCAANLPCTLFSDCPIGNSSCVGNECTVVLPRGGGVAFGSPASGFGSFRYVSNLSFTIPADAAGRYVVSPICLAGEGCPQVLTRLTGPKGLVPFTLDRLAVTVIQCNTAADCDDGLFCTGTASCVSNLCQAGVGPCTDPLLPFCDETLNSCVACLDDATCNDGVNCNGLEQCLGGVCQPGPDAPSGTPCGNPVNTLCTDPDTCDGLGSCLPRDAANGTSCNDGAFCTTNDRCQSGLCDPGGPTNCDDGRPCTADSCNEGTNSCDNILQAGNCLIDGICRLSGVVNPANACEECNPVLSLNGWSARMDGIACEDDGNSCTDDACVSGVCVNSPNSDPCDDGLFCNGADTCSAGGCADHAGDPCVAMGMVCNELLNMCQGCMVDTDCIEDGNPCTDEICVDSVCVPVNNVGPCDDGVFCNGTDSCSGGVCSNSSGNPCFGGSECANLCDELNDTCALPAGTSCTDDGDVCTQDVCDGAGVCGHPPAASGIACADDGIECTLDVCDGAGVCGHPSAPSGTACMGDGDDCTLDECDGAGACGHPPAPTGTTCPDDGDDCTVDECDGAGICAHPPAPLGTSCPDDGEECTNDECDGAGVCAHPPVSAAVVCDDGLPCTGTGEPGVGVDECDGAGNCVGMLDPSCADNCLDAADAFEGTNLANNTGFGTELQVSCAFLSTSDTWFVHTASCSGMLQFTTTGSEFDTVMTVFGACGGVELACDDDGGPGLASAATIAVVAGEDYFIRIAGFNGATGNALVNITRQDTCLIGGTCFAVGAVNPANECEACAMSPGAVDWSPRGKGTACGSGVPDDVQCDSPDSCNGMGVCEPNHKPAGAMCGDPTDTDCDNPDTCTGLGFCQVNLELVGFACGDPGDTDCDNPDTCDGAGVCLTNFEPVALACGSQADTGCDNPDTCDGVGACLDNFESVGFMCGSPANSECDNPDTCDGVGLCLANNEAMGTTCGLPGDSECDNPDTCTGTGLCSSNFEPVGLGCGSQADTGCDNPDTCNGAGGCLTNFESTGFACGSPADTDCDDPDSCDGSGTCLPNFELVGLNCGDPLDTDCDNPDTCDGAGICLDNLELVGFGCGDPADSECDNPDTCNGGGTCLDNLEPNGTTCGDITNDDCNNPDSCDGSGVCLNNFETFGTTCGSPGDTVCDNPDSCDGSGLCLPNFESNGLVCGDPTDRECDNPDSCDGFGACSPRDEVSGFPCGDPLDTDCDGADTCDGSGVCLQNFTLIGAFCGNGSDTDCDNPDSCDGGGSCLVNFEPEGLVCDDLDVCTTADVCTLGVCQGTFVPEVPVAVATGVRYFEVTPGPAGSSQLQSLLVTSSDFPCLSVYIQADGSLGDVPVFMTADAWGTVVVSDRDVIPNSLYSVQSECGSNRSLASTLETFRWGDITGDGFVQTDDILCVVMAFGGDFEPQCGNRLLNDLVPCEPDGFIQTSDILAVVVAFGDPDYPCATPCGGGACCVVGDPCVIATSATCPAPGTFVGEGVDCIPVDPCAGPSAAAGDSAVVSLDFSVREGRVLPGGRVTVDVSGSGNVFVRGFELGLDVLGGNSGGLKLVDAFVDESRRDWLFGGTMGFGLADVRGSGRVGGVGFDGGWFGRSSYLGTVVYEVSPDASGVFAIGLSGGRTEFHGAGGVVVEPTSPVLTVEVSGAVRVRGSESPTSLRK